MTFIRYFLVFSGIFFCIGCDGTNESFTGAYPSITDVRFYTTNGDQVSEFDYNQDGTIKIDIEDYDINVESVYVSQYPNNKVFGPYSVPSQQNVEFTYEITESNLIKGLTMNEYEFVFDVEDSSGNQSSYSKNIKIKSIPTITNIIFQNVAQQPASYSYTNIISFHLYGLDYGKDVKSLTVSQYYGEETDLASAIQTINLTPNNSTEFEYLNRSIGNTFTDKDLRTGTYKLVFLITDAKGNQSSKEKTMKLINE